MNPLQRQCRQRGMTLIELMIVLVIIGIIAAIAVPSYRAHAVDTGRTAAIADMQELTLFLERAFSAQGRYDNVASGGTLVQPLPFATSPQADPNVKYNLSLQSLSANAYTLRAVPTGGQLDDTDCGELRLDESGVQCILAGTVCSASADATERDAVAACF